MNRLVIVAAIAVIGLSASFGISLLNSKTSEDSAITASYIIQGETLDTVIALVEREGGQVTHELDIIDGVAALLTSGQLDKLGHVGGLRISADSNVEMAGKRGGGGKKPGGGSGGDSPVGSIAGPAAIVDATRLHQQGITGWGVGVAVVDSGSMPHVGLNKDPKGNWRFSAQYDATTDQVVAWARKGRRGGLVGVGIANDDDSGHGTHVQSVILNSATEANGTYHGIAPYAHLVSVKAFDANGQGSYADVIRGINWVVNNSADRKLRVLNLSLNATPKSHYWDDPLNQAVMRAWEAGLVVVVSAGNTGPHAMSIGVPGNVPYVITVGAMTDNYTPADGSDDRLATFSAAGPTVEGFVKPEVVAPGGHVVGLMDNSTTIATEHREFHDGGAYFTMSGTSQAASIVSGVAALILSAEPALTPDMVKCKIMNAARPAFDGAGNPAYSVFQQGAGMVNAHDAVYSWNYGCANRGLDIEADLAGDRHFGGRANQNADGTYYLMGLDGYLWTDAGVGAEGYLWTDGGVGVDGLLWTDGYLWTDGTTNINGYLWTDGTTNVNGYLWTDGGLQVNGFLWTDGLTETMSINNWVDQQ